MTRKQAILALLALFFGFRNKAGADDLARCVAVKINLDDSTWTTCRERIGLEVHWRGKSVEYTFQELWDAIQK